MTRKISNEKWEEYSGRQETLSTVIEIREGLINNALDLCQNSDRKNEVAQLVVSCAAEAWKKIIYLNFLFNEKDDNAHNEKCGKALCKLGTSIAHYRC